MNKKLLKLSKDVKEICTPLFSETGLDHFNYIHRNNTGDVTYLCSNEEWLDHYLTKNYPKIGAFEQKTELSKFNYILWNGLDRHDPILLDSKEILGVEYGVTIIKPERDGFGYYNLGTKSSDPSIINQYVNNLQEYEKFILEFQEKASAILTTSRSLKFSINLDANGPKNAHYPNLNGGIYFTERELECINYLSLGKTAEEVAIILHISRRTVESHINNVKSKMNCFNQFRLGYLLGKMNISKI